ncbi:MFS transporter [Streptomyces sp. NPDC020965]|uniref:MFS transporter n=1 Tax=Streptomyces sp. NPDC020965 TaxID=3365105 RepID=UPI003792FA27
MRPHATPTRSTGRAGPREWIGLTVLTLPLLVLALDVSVLFLAAPRLAAELRPSDTQALWIMDIYGFLIAGFLVTMGTIGDRIGRRRLLLIGGAVFAVASVLTAYAPTAETLIASRALLGIAGATLMPSTLALISNMFRDARQRSLAIAIWMTTMSVGVAIGPLVGGAMLEHFWWGSVFLLAVPVMALLVLFGPVLLPEHRDPDPGRLDLPSIALSLAALLPVVYALKHLAASGPDAIALLAATGGALAAVAFVRRQRRLTHPLLDLRLFRDRAFAVALALLLLGLLAINGVEYLLPHFLQLVEGLSPLDAGLWMLPVVFAAVTGSLVAPILSRRIGPIRVLAVGSLVSAAGFALVSRVDSVDGAPLLLTGAAIAMVGISPLPVLTTDLIVSTAPPEKAGSASALAETSGELGIGLGVAVMGSVVTAVYGAKITEELPQADPRAADSLTGAVTTAAELPAPRADELLSTARDAFTDGLNTVGLAAALLMLTLGVCTLILLRTTPGHDSPTPSEDSPEEPPRST